MAIVQLDKMTLYGAESHRDTVVQRLQALGCAHLVSLGSAEDDHAEGEVSSDVRDAYRFLIDSPQQRRQVRRADQFDREQVVADALRLQDKAQELRDERDDLQQAIRDSKPWGEFKLPTNAMVGGVRFWFFIVRLRDVEQFRTNGLPWREVRRDHQNAYLVILSRDRPQELPGQLVELNPRPLSELRQRLEVVEEQLEELHHQRVGLTRWCKLLASALDEADDAAERAQAERRMLNGRSVFALQGWIPRDSTDQIRRFAKQHGLAVNIEPPDPDVQPPTLLHNPERLAGGEGLVTFYKTPDYRAWDPSIVAYISFAIFFAMIMADAGYGLVLAILTAYLWNKMGNSLGGRRGRNVLATVVGFTIVYGVMCGSYFGISPSADSLLSRLRVLDAQSQSVMMPLSIVIGVVHLSLANLVTAWLQRGSATALASLGWISVMAGAMLAGMATFADVGESVAGRLSQTGTILLVAGLVAVFLFSSQRPLLSLSLKNHALRVVDGLGGLTGLSGLFGDVLSYLRLFALGLSGAKLSETFNSMGAGAWDSAGFGVIAAIAIVLLGHTLNLVLCIMSGVVHGLRLNCIEFFKWGLPEEGHMFRAFAKRAR